MEPGQALGQVRHGGGEGEKIHRRHDPHGLAANGEHLQYGPLGKAQELSPHRDSRHHGGVRRVKPHTDGEAPQKEKGQGHQQEPEEHPKGDFSPENRENCHEKQGVNPRGNAPENQAQGQGQKA